MIQSRSPDRFLLAEKLGVGRQGFLGMPTVALDPAVACADGPGLDNA